MSPHSVALAELIASARTPARRAAATRSRIRAIRGEMISAGPAPRRRCSRADRKYTADLPQPVRWTTSTRRCCSTSAEIASNWPARKSASARPVRSFSAVRASLYGQALPPVGEPSAPVSQVRLTTAPPENGGGGASLRRETGDDELGVGPPGPGLILARQAAQTFRGGLVIPQRILLGGQSAAHAGLVLLLLSDTGIVRELLPVLGIVREVVGVRVDGHGGAFPGWLIL